MLELALEALQIFLDLAAFIVELGPESGKLLLEDGLAQALEVLVLLVELTSRKSLGFEAFPLRRQIGGELLPQSAFAGFELRFEIRFEGASLGFDLTEALFDVADLGFLRRKLLFGLLAEGFDERVFCGLEG